MNWLAVNALTQARRGKHARDATATNEPTNTPDALASNNAKIAGKGAFDQVTLIKSKANKKNGFPLKEDVDNATSCWRYFGVIISWFF
jgi:hypothetical protein